MRAAVVAAASAVVVIHRYYQPARKEIDSDWLAPKFSLLLPRRRRKPFDSKADAVELWPSYWKENVTRYRQDKMLSMIKKEKNTLSQ